MIKLVCLITRPQDVPREVFVEWWLTHHAAVASRLPELRRYSISVTHLHSRSAVPYDGVAELWFDSVAAMEQAFSSPEGEACAREDRELIGSRVGFVVEEHIII